jgi:hypothetical protein
MMSGNYPDQGLPGDQPGIDNSLPPHVDQGLPIPVPPPGVWPPPTVSHPIVPVPPGSSVPPGTIWPNPHPPRPDQGLPGSQPGIDNTLPGSQPGVDNTLPGAPPVPTQPIYNTYWMLCYTPGYGWRYVSVDPSLTVGYPLPAPQPTPTPHG